MRINNILLFFLCSQLTSVSTDDVLILQPFGPKSHREFVVPIAKQLALRGHHVTFVSTHSFEDSLPTNITEITYTQFQINFKILQNITRDIVIHGWSINIFKRYYNYHSEMCRQFFDSGLIQKWMSEGKKFPIVIIDFAVHECILPLWRNVGESLVIINSSPLIPIVRTFMNLHTPYSIVPFMTLPLSNHMNFFQRCLNAFYWVISNCITRLMLITLYKNVILPYFPDTKPIDETLKNISLVLANHDPVVTPPCTTLPTIIDIGGVQCRPPVPLQDGKLKSFVDGSDENGFILFSFGTVINVDLIDEKLKNTFIAAFGRIKQRVVWKYETQLTNLPSNVMITDWFPQQDLLGHPKIRVFINHGGLKSVQEGIYHAVPQVCLPLTFDQPSIVTITSEYGIVIKLNPSSVTVEEVVQAITKASEDKEMKKTVQYYSSIFRNRETKPLDKAIYWIEYVMTYRGALHLQTAAANLNFFQYYLLDVFGLVVGILIAAGLLYWLGIKKLLNAYCPHLITKLRNAIFVCVLILLCVLVQLLKSNLE